ncbi:hypothetical protein CI610_02275 [invertebrate metagenome]|uniref:Transposase IS4-like domain-containing protein n=1 Tax=invertebrate metagenome TaxID=1711999 RepID=A0A2H9T6D8_9ZZZZ
MSACHKATKGSIIAIDGKTLKSSYDKSRKRRAIHRVSAFSAANNVVLGQVKTSEKSNEITAIPELLDLLDIKGCLVTIDAMGCQRNIAKAITKKEGDYLLAVKGNQGRLEQAFKKHFSLNKLSQWESDSYRTDEQSHGRFESCLHIVSDIFDEFVNYSFDWPGMKTLGVVLSGRIVDGEMPDKDEISLRYYISSAKLSA